MLDGLVEIKDEEGETMGVGGGNLIDATTEAYANALILEHEE